MTSIRYALKSVMRDSFAGQVCYCLSLRTWCKPEFETSSYVIPTKYLVSHDSVNVTPKISSDSKSENTTDRNEINEILVDWDGPNDISNPRNWPFSKKAIVAIVMAICTASLYMSSSLFTPAEGQLMEHFQTSKVKVMLGLSMYLWGYGIASVWFSPMSENPLFGGRLYIYLFNQLVCVCLQIPTALSNHVASFAILRFLAGITAAPPLSTGGATCSDLFEFPSVVYAVVVWTISALTGPFVGPLIGAALVQYNTWRWAFWYLLIMSSGVLVLMIFLFPETSEQAILMKKARSLRRRTGNQNIVAPGDILLRSQKTSQVLKHIFWQPAKLTMQEPALLLMDIHVGLMYSVMYLYFEAVPISYGGEYKFNLVQQGLAYLSLLVGCLVFACFFVPYIKVRLVRPVSTGSVPDVFAVFGDAAIVSSVCAPAGILIFGWASHHTVHWVVSMLGNLLFGGSLWLMFQAYLGFISNLYPPSKVGSALASNGVARAVVAAAFPLFAQPMYDTLAIDGYPVGWGCTMLAFICIILISLPVYLRIRGRVLHERAVEKYGEH